MPVCAALSHLRCLGWHCVLAMGQHCLCFLPGGASGASGRSSLIFFYFMCVCVCVCTSNLPFVRCGYFGCPPSLRRWRAAVYPLKGDVFGLQSLRRACDGGNGCPPRVFICLFIYFFPLCLINFNNLPSPPHSPPRSHDAELHERLKIAILYRTT